MEKRSNKTADYTIPLISISDPEDWFIYLYFTHDGKKYLRKYREGVNRIKDKGQRMAYAEQLRQEREDWLKKGWNPIADPEFKLRLIRPSTVKQAMYLKEAISFALSKKKLAIKSKLGYSSMLNFIKGLAVKHVYDLLPIAEYDRGVCLSLIDECAKGRTFTNHNYNKHVSVLRAVFSELVDYRMLNVNPLLDYKDREVPESNLYQDYTEDEKRRIADHLLKVHPQLFTVMSMIYHTGIRPKEVLALRVHHIDLEQLIITIAPIEGGENSKTLSVRKVPINPHLCLLLKGMNLDKFPNDYYVFGSPFVGGRSYPIRENGKRVYGAMVSTYLTPNPTAIKRDTVTKLWRKLIMDEPPKG